MPIPDVVPDFTRLRVAVVGDLIADRYLHARPSRISREAPVLVLRHERETLGAGGAANVARNCWALGARTILVGAVGMDVEGRELLRILDRDDVDVEMVTAVPGWTTPTKTRVLGAEPGRTAHQLLRIDREPAEPLDGDVGGRVAEALLGLAGRVDALLVSDYGYGLVDGRVAEAAREVQRAGAVLVLDPRERAEHLPGATALTPNVGELAMLAGEPETRLGTREAVAAAAARVIERHDPEHLLVTLGSGGMALFSRGEQEGRFVPASGSDEVIDVSGAGDTAVATFTLGLAAGLEGPRAMRLANAASGIVVMELGTAVCTLSKLRSSLPLAPRVEPAPARGVEAPR